MERICIITLSIIDALMILALVLFSSVIMSNIYILTVYTLIMVLISGYIVYLFVSVKCNQSMNQYDNT